MDVFSLEYSKTAYRADFAVYGLLVFTLPVLMVLGGPVEQRASMAFAALLGLFAWSGVEYVLHRFVLHGLLPFRAWHAEHHLRPMALLGTPTVVSVALVGMCVFLPALVAGGVWTACGLSLGVLSGYLAYSVTHHAAHHWRADGAWLRRVKIRHARHHHRADRPGCYGVTSGLWDRIFRTVD